MLKMLRLAVALCLVGAVVCGPPVSRSRSEIEEFKNFLESTRTERGVIIGQRINPNSRIWENSGKYQGDILLDDEQVESMVEQFAQGRNAYIWPGTHWPDRTVVYEFAPGMFYDVQKEYIQRIIRIIEERTCIRFRLRNPDEFDYVLVTGYNDGCYANVGYWAGRGVHTLNLAFNSPGYGCFRPITIVHEWLHIIGFFHMQSTHNRNWYVRINWWNVEKGTEHNFDRFSSNITSNLDLPYEYDSCMHYRADAYSINGRPTITALRPHNGTMGQSNYVTKYDFMRVDRHYGCQRNEEDYQPLYAEDLLAQAGEAPAAPAEETPKTDE